MKSIKYGFIRAVLLLSLALLTALPTLAFAKPCAVLLHGLARSEASMQKMQKRLEAEGYRVVNMSYPSRKYSIEVLADKAIKPALANCEGASPINFVTHSLGGILLRQYLSTNTLDTLGRVVMLGPPNKGSEVVDKLGKLPGFRWMNGDAGLQLSTEKTSVPNTLGDAQFDLGVVAGNRSINLILSMLIPGEDDGKVSVNSAKLSGMNDFILLPVTHPFIMKNNRAIEQVIHYLAKGYFAR